MALVPVGFRSLCCVVLTLAAATCAVAQAPSKESLQGAAASEETKTAAIAKVRGLAEQIAELKNPAARITGLARIARTLCPHDKELARSFFIRAHDMLRDAKENDVSRLRLTLISQTARCDSALAFKLNSAMKGDEADPLVPQDSRADLAAGGALITEDPQQAARFLGRSLRGPRLSDLDLQGLMMTMMSLRDRGDAAAADNVFLQAVAALRAESRAEANRIALVGQYLFTSSFGVERGGVTFVAVSNVPTYMLTHDKPWVTPEIARPYLEMAVDVFSRPVADAQQQLVDYICIYQLTPKAERYAPDLLPLFHLVRQKLDPNVPDRFRQPATYAALNDTGPPLSQQEPDFERERDPVRRAAWRASAIQSMWQAGNLEGVRKAIAGIEDKEARDRLTRLVDFGVTAKQIENGKLEEAEQVAQKLQPGIKRAFLYLALANAYAAQDRDRAQQFWNMAMKDADHADRKLRARFMVGVAHAGAPLDTAAALEPLEQAIRGLNGEEPEPRPNYDDTAAPWARRGTTRPMPMTQFVTANENGFSEDLGVSQYPIVVRIFLKGLDTWNFTPAMMARFAKEADRATAIVAKLDDEAARAGALAAVASAYLEPLVKKEPPTTKAN